MGAGGHAHLFVVDVDSPEIEPNDRHHLERSLRLGPDQVVTVADGVGRWRTCHLIGGRLEPSGAVQTQNRIRPEVRIGFAPTKGERPEWAVQKLTELGVDGIVVFMAARSVVRWSGDRATSALDRLRRVAREAAMQSRRAWLPAVEYGGGFADVAGRLSADGGVAMADMTGGPPTLACPVILVGPEGGWDQLELGAGLERVSLGPQVLRSETAAMAAGTVLCALRAGLVAPMADMNSGV